MSKTYDEVTINEFVRAIGLQRQTYYTVYKALWYIADLVNLPS